MHAVRTKQVCQIAHAATEKEYKKALADLEEWEVWKSPELKAARLWFHNTCIWEHKVYSTCTLTGGIKSLDPPCLEEAMSHGEHPFTCSNCARQDRDLKNTLQRRRSGSLKDTKNRIGLSGSTNGTPEKAK